MYAVKLGPENVTGVESGTMGISVDVNTHILQRGSWGIGVIC